MSHRLGRPNEAFSGRARPAFDPGLPTAGNRTTSDRMVDASIQAALQSGKVILQNKGLREFPKQLFVAGANAEAWWSLEAMRVIDLTGNSISELPEEISAFYETLSTLRCGSNQLKSLPVAALTKLMCLKLLDLSMNKLSAFPQELCLPSIVELNLSGNPLPRLPNLSGMAPSLEILRLSGMGLDRLSDDVGSCSKLMELDVSCNVLTELPASLGHCKRLKYLKADQNRIRDMGNILEGCASLVRLDLNQNQLRQAPFLPQTSTLVEVLLSNNQLEVIPGQSIVRPSLTTLDLSTNNISELPVEMRGLNALHTLDLRNNNLAVLPAWLGFMPALTRLSVEGNPLRSLRTILSATAAATGSSASSSAGGTGGAAATQALKEYLRTRATDAEQYAAGENGDYTALPAPSPSSATRAFNPYGGYNQAPEPSVASSTALAEVITTSSHDGAMGPRGKIPPHVCHAASQEAWTRAVREATAAGGRFSAIPYFASSVPGTSAAGTEAAGRLLSFTLSALDGGEGIALLKRLRVLNLDGQGGGGAGSQELRLPMDLLASCPNLEEVSLASCGLTAIPPALLVGSESSAAGSLLVLKDLNLSRNRLGAVGSRPLDVSRLPSSLAILDLTFNGLKTLPNGLAALSSLHTLLLSSNEITLDNGAGAFGNGSNPRARPASASTAASAAVGAGIVDDGSSLPSSLIHLDLASNGMLHLPASLFGLKHLQTLDLRQNELQIVPSALAALPVLEGLSIEGNPQRGVRPAVVDKGPAAVLAYLKTRLTDHDISFVRSRIERGAATAARREESYYHSERAGGVADDDHHYHGGPQYGIGSYSHAHERQDAVRSRYERDGDEYRMGPAGPAPGYAVSQSHGSQFDRERAYRAAMREGEAAAGSYGAYQPPPPQNYAPPPSRGAGVPAPTTPFAIGFDPSTVSATAKYQDRFQTAGGVSTAEWDTDAATRAARFSDGLPSTASALDEAAVRAEAARRFHANTPSANVVVGVPTSQSGLYDYGGSNGRASMPSQSHSPRPSSAAVAGARAAPATSSEAAAFPGSSAARIGGGGVVVGPSVAVMRELPPELGGPGLHEQLVHVREQIRSLDYEMTMTSSGPFQASLKRKMTVLRAQENRILKEMGVEVI
jgi:Leucine-rich repeat (LRR) protein